MKKILFLIFSRTFFEKLFVITLFVITLFVLHDFLAIFFITFIFAYLFLEAGEYITLTLHRVIENRGNPKNTAKWLRYITPIPVITILYILFIITVIFLVYSVVPKIVHEIERLVVNLPMLFTQLQNMLQNLEKSIGITLGSDKIVSNLLNGYSLQDLGKTILGSLRDTGGILIQFFIGIILSYVYIIDRRPIAKFLGRLKDGNFAFVYREAAYIGNKLAYGFGKVFKAQAIIALVNSILTVIGLIVIGHLFGHRGFPYIFTLALIVLIFGFIPVLGIFLSGVPIVIIGYGFGGFNIVIAIVLMIAVIHAIEAYILNPKIVSSYVNFPVFVTFITLLVAEHFFGFIGMLIGVPLLSVTIAICRDFDTYISSIRTRYSHQHGSPNNRDIRS